MKLYNYQELQEKIYPIDNNELYFKICRNIKRIRQERYEQFKKEYNNYSLNPYTTENIAALLNYNHTHYKRFESEGDKTKRIPLNKLIILSLILDTTLDELIK